MDFSNVSSGTIAGSVVLGIGVMAGAGYLAARTCRTSERLPIVAATSYLPPIEYAGPDTSEELKRLLQELRNEGWDIGEQEQPKPLYGRINPIPSKSVSAANTDRWHLLRFPKPTASSAQAAPVVSMYPTLLPRLKPDPANSDQPVANADRWHLLRLPESTAPSAPAPVVSMYPTLLPRPSVLPRSDCTSSYRNENAGLSDDDALAAAIALSQPI